jgi:hypothetical protein
VDKLSAILALLVTLSMGTERVTEVIKGLPVLSAFFSAQWATGSRKEEFRKASVQIIAIAVGTGFAYAAQSAIASLLGLKGPVQWGMLFLFGALASGGSGFWNSTLDFVRAAKQAKEAVVQQAQQVSQTVTTK